jgi:hypothetical protein
MLEVHCAQWRACIMRNDKALQSKHCLQTSVGYTACLPAPSSSLGLLASEGASRWVSAFK